MSHNMQTNSKYTEKYNNEPKKIFNQIKGN